jgi:hypothetical protein
MGPIATELSRGHRHVMSSHFMGGGVAPGPSFRGGRPNAVYWPSPTASDGTS